MIFSKAVLATAAFYSGVAAFPGLALNGLSARATGGVVSGAPANPVTFPGGSDRGGAKQQFNGDGSTGAGWPARSDWMSFDALWNKNLPRMQQTCGWNNWGANNSPQELQQMRDAIQVVSGNSKVDQRFILAIILQESNGCVRVRTTPNVSPSIFNPGLMQSHSGKNACNNADNNAPVSPCPQVTIQGMITDGTQGTDAGDGLAQSINKAFQAGLSGNDRDSTQAFFRAARLYNSGSYQNINDLNSAPPGTTASYVNDVANRLVGWLGN